MGGGGSKSKEKEKEVHRFPATPHGQVMYGEKGQLCVVMFTSMDKVLHEYILEHTRAFNCEEKELLDLGFAKCIDYPQLPDHVYYEGYFHSFKTADPVPSINPRNGRGYNKPPAPKALRAFYVAFREKNKDRFNDMKERILKVPLPETDNEENNEENIKTRQLVADIFVDELLCGDLAIQVHCGTGVNGDNIGWHRDAINSMFHMATSIRGKRALHCQLATTPEDNAEREVYVDQLDTPNIYISSPAFFRHAVEYPEQLWEDRTIAIQSRFLITRSMYNILAVTDNEFKTKVSEIIAEALIDTFDLPSLEEVKDVANTLADYEGTLKVEELYLDGTKEHFY